MRIIQILSWTLGVGVMLFSLTAIGLAMENEPDGFRGLKWGDPPGEGMTYLKTDDNFAYYQRKNDTLKIGRVDLAFIHYLFYNGRFAEVQTASIVDDTVGSLEDVANLRFGFKYRQKCDTCPPPGTVYSWTGSRSKVILWVIGIEREGVYECMLTISSRRISDEKFRDRIQKREEEERKIYEERQEAAEEGLDDF